MKKILKNNIYIKNALILVLVFSIFISIDLITKNLLFDKEAIPKNHKPILHKDWYVWGFRSQAHYGTLLLDSININISSWYIALFGYLIAILFILFAIFSEKKIIVISFSIALAGIMGNTFDNTWTPNNVNNAGYVRNIMFLPWADKGTFNFADVWIIFGAPMAGLGIIMYLFLDRKKNKIKNKKTK